MSDSERARSEAELRALLQRIDGRGYKAYRDLRGAWTLPGCTLFVDRVQSDPFAAPSRARLRVAMHDAQLPEALRANPVRQLALCDALAREVRSALRGDAHSGSEQRGSGKSGLLSIDAGGQEVLQRSAVALDAEWVEARIEVGLPAAGRRVLGRAAESVLLHRLPEVAARALTWPELPGDVLHAFVECVENQEALRAQLSERGLVAFVGNGARLARASGASDRPMPATDCVPFRSPPELEQEFAVPNALPDGAASVRGMGLPRGVTLVVGGGYHGKSTLLRAIERGVYPHVPGDGREWVVSDAGLVKIRAEDGRAVAQVDIHAFIRALPAPAGAQARDTRAFSSEDASGSTSQAANIAEALEVGASGLLLDEDTSATNFMLRDARMQALVPRESEPITPFLERVRELNELGVSSVLVMGGCGDYFDVADRVIRMRDYVASDATQEARTVAETHPTQRTRDALEPLVAPLRRAPLPESFDASRGRREVQIRAKGCDALLYGALPVDLRGLEQLVDSSQTRAIGYAIHLAAERFADGERSLSEVLDDVEACLDAEGLDALEPFHRPAAHPGALARPRRFELAAAIGRMRSLRVRQLDR